MNPAALEASSLGRRYGGTWALRDCSLSLPTGRVVALVGPNGAGKTTLLHLATGLLQPSNGSIRCTPVSVWSPSASGNTPWKRMRAGPPQTTTSPCSRGTRRDRSARFASVVAQGIVVGAAVMTSAPAVSAPAPASGPARIAAVVAPRVAAVIEGLAPATWYFALRTVTHDSRQSRLSRVVSKRVR